LPSNAAETKRIVNAGGTVEEGRLQVIDIERILINHDNNTQY